VRHLLRWRRRLLYLRKLWRWRHDTIVTGWFWFRARLRFGLWLRLRAWLRFGLRYWLGFLHRTIHFGHILQTLCGAFHDEAHADQSDSGTDQAEATATGGFNLTVF